MKVSTRLLIATSMVCAIIGSSGIRASSPPSVHFDQGPVFTLLEENDWVVDNDRHYTQGIRLSYLQADNSLPDFLERWAEHIPRLGLDVRAYKFGYQFGQSMFTPENLRTKEVVPHDRPYAGWLYTGVILQRRGWLGNRHPVMDNFQIDIGVIGPGSLAEEAQKVVHKWIDDDRPRGWHHQLRNEPGLALKYQRSWRFSLIQKDSAMLELIPRAGTSVGNVETSLRAGTMLRYGQNLPDDFGVMTIGALSAPEGGLSASGPPPKAGWYVFVSGEAKGMFYRAFQDGNLYKTSHEVDRETLQAEWSIGAVLVLERVDLGFTLVGRSDEFETQAEVDYFGSFYIKIKI